MSEVKSAKKLAMECYWVIEERQTECALNCSGSVEPAIASATNMIRADRRAIIEKCKEALCIYCHDECMHTDYICGYKEAMDSVLSEIEKEE